MSNNKTTRSALTILTIKHLLLACSLALFAANAFAAETDDRAAKLYEDVPLPSSLFLIGLGALGFLRRSKA